jgi:hypothetical protein
VLATIVLALGLASAAPAQPAPGGGPSSVTGIVVRAVADGTTVVEVRADAPIEPYGYRHYHISEPPHREVVRVRGISRPYPLQEIPVGDENILRIRVGHHADHLPPELHLVLDLAAPDVRITDEQLDDGVLVLRLSAVDVSAGPEPQTSAQRATTQTIYRAPADAASAEGMTIAEIVSSVRPDGSTLLRLTADRALPERAHHDLLDPQDPSRHAMVLVGTRLPGCPEHLVLGGPALRRIQVLEVPRGDGVDTQLLFELASERVRLERISTVGEHIAILFSER